VFLSPSGTDGYLQVTAVATPRQPPRSLSALVLVSRPDDLYGLTRRELEVLGFLIEGHSNPHIAAELFITERTVAAHLEHIRAKLSAGSRTVAAVSAMRQGLYIPPELAGG
jgi:DNA-binding NarL/FixJ family response regulator